MPQFIPEQTPKEVEDVLDHGPILSAEGLRKITAEDPANQVYRCELEGGLVAYFKPERDMIDPRISPESQVNRERAAYLVSRALGFGHVPVTVIRTIEGLRGTLKQEVKGALLADVIDKARKEKIPLKKKVQPESLADAGLFDYLTSAGDHSEENFIVDTKGRVHAFDNALAFTTEPEYEWSAPLEEVKRGLAVSKETTRRLETFWTDENKKAVLRRELAPLLSEEEIAQFFSRLERVVVLGEIGREKLKVA